MKNKDYDLLKEMIEALVSWMTVSCLFAGIIWALWLYLGPKYFSFLPNIYQNIGIIDWVLMLGFIRAIVITIAPYSDK